MLDYILGMPSVMESPMGVNNIFSLAVLDVDLVFDDDVDYVDVLIYWQCTRYL